MASTSGTTEMDSVRTRQAAVVRKLQELEQQLQRLPVGDERTAVQQRLAALEQQMAALEQERVELIRQAGGLAKLTATGYMKQQLPQLKHRVSDRASSSRTKARRKRTFAGLLRWEGFVAEVEKFIGDLDDTEACYWPLVFENTEVVDGGIRVFKWTPADESEVRGVIFRCLQGVTEVAASIGYEVEYTGGGSGRSLSNTDLLVRHKATTKRDAASSLILGAVEVKGKWQLGLSGSDSLVDVLQDPKKGKMAVEVIQQAFGDAVMDEAPLLIISNYEVTYFIKRNVQNVADKQLIVSPPVSWDSQSPHPLAAWLFCLHHASELWDDNAKSRLAHAEVPATPSCGYMDETAMYFLSRDGRCQVPQRQQPARQQDGSGNYNQQQQGWPGLQQHKQVQEDCGLGSICLASKMQGCPADVYGDLDLSSGSPGSGSARGSYTSSVTGSSNSSRSSSQGGSQVVDPQHWRSLMQSGPSEAVAALAVLPDSCLSYSDSVLSATSSSVVVKGTVCGTPAAIKIYTLEEAALASFTREVFVYLAMQQQPCIVPLLAVGLLPHTDRPVIALSEGQPMPEQLPSHLRTQAQGAMLELHQAGWSHGDVSVRNMLLYNKRVVFCDLETCAQLTEAGREQDMQDLHSMLE